MADWAIEPLADHHDRARFNCGKAPLDDWIRRYVGQYQRRILALAEQVGILAVIVDAIDEQARGFYLHRDFEPFQDDPSRLFLMIRDLRQAGLKPLAE